MEDMISKKVNEGGDASKEIELIDTYIKLVEVEKTQVSYLLRVFA